MTVVRASGWPSNGRESRQTILASHRQQICDDFTGIVAKTQHSEAEECAAEQQKDDAVKKNEPGRERPRHHGVSLGSNTPPGPRTVRMYLLLPFSIFRRQISNIDIYHVGQAFE